PVPRAEEGHQGLAQGRRRRPHRPREHRRGGSRGRALVPCRLCAADLAPRPRQGQEGRSPHLLPRPEQL
ncbi:MAG: Cell_wall_hydrolase_CwlJ, partial [uncultured Sphingomonadaceae bacterium]